MNSIIFSGSYPISIDGKNYIVSNQKGEDCSFHQNVEQALMEVRRRLLRDKLKKAAKKAPLQLDELIKIIQEQDAWIKEALHGK